VAQLMPRLPEESEEITLDEVTFDPWVNMVAPF
jgi:hypothetical protein